MSYLQAQIGQLIQQAKQQEHEEPYYEVLQYITLDGTQYFNTGYYGNTINTSADFRISVDSFDSNSGICGSRNDTTATESSMCILFLKGPVTTSTGTHQNSLRLDWVSGDGTTFTSSLTLGGETTVTCTSNKAVINGTSYTSTGTRNYDQNNPFYIGTVCSGSGTAFTPGLNGKIYVFKIFESGVLAHDYVPVLDSQMRPCLYDKISKTFLYAKKVSDGTTTYDLGFNRWNKYDVDYIGSSGTQYIDTGHKATLNTEIRATMALKNKSSNMFLFGARNGGASNSAIGAQNNPPNNIFAVDFNNSNYGTTRLSIVESKIEEDIFYDFVISKNLRDLSYNGTSLGSNTTVCTDTFASQNSITICTYNGSSLGYNKFSGYVKKFTILENGDIIRNFIPTVWHNSNTTAVACMYDEVYNKMYTNAGTGSFKAYIQNGSDVYEVGKSVSGTPSSSVSGASNCFDTGLYGTQDTTVKYIGIAYDSNSTSGQLFGSYDGTQTTSQNLTINSTGTSGNTAPIRFDGKVITTPIRIATDKSVSIINSKYGLWVNDTLHGSWGDVNDFTTTTTLLILKCNNSVNVRNNGCGYCLILEKDEPVAEYIPVKNGSAIGLYDKVSKTINTGVGTINFNVLD